MFPMGSLQAKSRSLHLTLLPSHLVPARKPYALLIRTRHPQGPNCNANTHETQKRDKELVPFSMEPPVTATQQHPHSLSSRSSSTWKQRA